MSKDRIDAWMPLYVADWDLSTGHLTNEQDGAYGRLVRWYWRNGRPPMDDDAALASIVRVGIPQWRKLRPVLAAFFTIEDGVWRHDKVEGLMAKQGLKYQARADSGRAGAASKWGGDTAPERGKVKRSERLAEARKKGRHTAEEWLALVTVCGGRCVRCGSDGPVVKDHIEPIYQGGSDSIENLQPLCTKCNAGKGPETTDHRPEGWRGTPGKTPVERLRNASQSEPESRKGLLHSALPTQRDAPILPHEGQSASALSITDTIPLDERKRLAAEVRNSMTAGRPH